MIALARHAPRYDECRPCHTRGASKDYHDGQVELDALQEDLHKRDAEIANLRASIEVQAGNALALLAERDAEISKLRTRIKEMEVPTCGICNGPTILSNKCPSCAPRIAIAEVRARQNRCPGFAYDDTPHGIVVTHECALSLGHAGEHDLRAPGPRAVPSNAWRAPVKS